METACKKRHRNHINYFGYKKNGAGKNALGKNAPGNKPSRKIAPGKIVPWKIASPLPPLLLLKNVFCKASSCYGIS